jgi:hypothetical protein
MNNIATFLIGLFCGMAATWLFEFVLEMNKKLRDMYHSFQYKISKDYHVHHSAYGLLFIVLGVVLLLISKSSALFCMGLGVGIIAIHAISEGRIIFVEKQR